MSLFGPKRVKATPAELATALLFPVWQRSGAVDLEEVEMIARNTNSSEASIQEELFCLDYWATAVGVAAAMDGRYAADVIAAYHLVQQLMTDSLPASPDARKLAAIKSWFAAQVEGFKRSYPDAWQAIEHTRQYVPEYSVVAKKHDEYQQVASASGSDLQSALHRVCDRFAVNVGSPKNPIVAATAFTMVVFTMKMVRDVVPKYQVISAR